jgi:sterol desaturase/sphingolipid hydroxylase (fatty acid hydroxylase superfamily)
MYFTYEVAHRRTHTHAPRGRYSRWTRRNHLLHHAGSPMRNFGVTTDWLDRLTGTHDAIPEPLRLSAKIAPGWMLDPDGTVKAEFAADYELI